MSEAQVIIERDCEVTGLTFVITFSKCSNTHVTTQGAIASCMPLRHIDCSVKCLTTCVHKCTFICTHKSEIRINDLLDNATAHVDIINPTNFLLKYTTHTVKGWGASICVMFDLINKNHYTDLQLAIKDARIHSLENKVGVLEDRIDTLEDQISKLIQHEESEDENYQKIKDLISTLRK
jgi:peptidoglycan hydrolase CwlO-like protein